MTYESTPRLTRTMLPNFVMTPIEAKGWLDLLKKQGGCLTDKQYEESTLKGDAFWLSSNIKAYTSASYVAWHKGLMILFEIKPTQEQLHNVATELANHINYKSL